MLRQGVKGARKKAHQDEGALAATYREAMRLWDEQTAQGVSRADRLRGLTASLKAAWPKGRTEEWKYLCTNCLDYGLSMSTCPGDATCGRPKPHLAHEFGTPCWCQLGKRFRTTPKQATDYTDAAQTRPSRVGRR